MRAHRQSGNRTPSLKILLPINAADGSQPGLRYALRHRQQGRAIEVVLLNIGEEISQRQVMRFKTQENLAAFQLQRADALFQEALRQFARENIACRTLFRQGDIVFSILDVAEELECDEIVLPAAKPGMASLFSFDIVTRVMRQRRSIPVVIIDSHGAPA